MDTWYLDSGCSNHMSGNKIWFSELDESFKKSVRLGNDARLKVEGKGSIKVKMNGEVHTIVDVFYVPELKNNLLSIGQLQERGLAVLFDEGYCRIYHKKKGLILESIMESNRMFKLLSEPVIGGKTDSEKCFHTANEGDTYLWHCRYAHLGIKYLKLLKAKDMVTGLPDITDSMKVCEVCLKGKQHRDPIPRKSKWRATERLELVHADICGPIAPTSTSGERYFLSFIDDASRKIWAYLLTDKSEAFMKFKYFKSMVEKETNLKIKCLRTDRG